jgi:protein-tyrosine phosphatase
MTHAGSTRSHADILQIFDVYANSSSYPVMIHCTQGKDRTGLSVALALFLINVPLKAISEDYVISEEKLLPERAERIEEIEQMGMSEDFAGCPPDFIESMLSYVESQYGSVEKYLTTIGVDIETQQKVIEALKA